MLVSKPVDETEKHAQVRSPFFFAFSPLHAIAGDLKGSYGDEGDMLEMKHLFQY